MEEQLTDRPDDLSARTQLLGNYFLGRWNSPEIKKTRQAHVLWIIEHHPEADICGSPEAGLDAILESVAYREARELWLKKSDGDGVSAKVLGNAANFLLLQSPEDAERLLKRAQALEPQNPEWPQRLGHLYQLKSRNLFGKTDREAAKRALIAYEQALDASPKADRYLLLDDTAKAALAAGELEKARRYATEVLDLAVETDANRDWNHGNAIHHGNLVLGRVALAEGKIEEAEKFLLKAGKTPGSPQLNSFGPNMLLAKELLEKGRKEAVIEYLRLCGRFWNKSQTDKWIEHIEAGKTPDFGANLDY
ncbi:MAG TPA: RNA polymerase subunit sigma-24 [Phycisphaerae bacterium]